MAALRAAEEAKRRLVFQIDELGLPLASRHEDPDGGLAFDLLSSYGGAVSTGHAGGVITLDLSESDDAHRESVRQELGEPYRTVLGHLRHEIGHHYWPALVDRAGRVEEFRALFGDERADYAGALDRHYAEGPPHDWPDRYVSSYATMHPWEDWAESFAHYLHIRDTLQTAGAFGLRVAAGGAAPGVRAPARAGPGPGGHRGAVAAAHLRPERREPQHGQGRPVPVRAGPRRGGEAGLRAPGNG
jgi:hypothetical protein